MPTKMPLNLQDATESWAKARFKAVGHTGMAKLIIAEASVLETKLTNRYDDTDYYSA